MKYAKYFLIIFLSISSSLALSEVQVIKENENGLRYLLLVKAFFLRLDLKNFEKEDSIFGTQNVLAPKNNDYKSIQATYRQIPGFDDIKIGLLKKREDRDWGRVRFTGKPLFLIPILPNCDESFFSKELGLTKINVEYDEDLNVYNYLYKTKNHSLITFVVDKKQFNGESYPRNFQAILVKMNTN